MKDCPECKGAKTVQADVPCRVCKGRGYTLNEHKMPVDCPAKCTWGAITITERCPTCRGKGVVPD